MKSIKLKQLYNYTFNNKRSMKIIVEFLLLFLAATLGGILSPISYIDSRARIFIWITIVVVLIFSIILFGDWYEKPERLDKTIKIERIHTQVTERIPAELEEIKNRLKRIE